MHHRKPALHTGRGDAQSEAEDGLAASITLRMPTWMRELLDDIATNPDPPLSFDATSTTSATSVAREFLLAGALTHQLDGTAATHRSDRDGHDRPVDSADLLPGSLDATFDSQLKVRMPSWLRTYLRDMSGTDAHSVADGEAATARELIATGYHLYTTDHFPWGEQTPPGDEVLCPNCAAAETEAIWERSFEYPLDLDDFFDELSHEQENPYRRYIERHYHQHGWDPASITNTDHPLYGLDRRELSGDHPDVDDVVTVCHCHLCEYTDHKADFIRAHYNEYHKRDTPTTAPPATHDQPTQTQPQSQPQTQTIMTPTDPTDLTDPTETAPPTDTPAYIDLQNVLDGQAMTMGDSLSGDAGEDPDPDPDPDGKALEAISAGRTMGQDDRELVGDLASLGYSAETTADALDLTVDEVEDLAERRLRELMLLQTDETALPDADDLWRLYHILFREEYVSTYAVDGVKDIAAQMEWDSLVAWIEDTIERGDGDALDQSTWLAAVEAAVRHEGADGPSSGAGAI